MTHPVPYEPPLSRLGSPLIPGHESEIYPGVRGYAVFSTGLVLIPLIIGDGSGQVGKMLDQLSHRCRVVNVTSPKLEAMLTRRGYIRELVRMDGDDVDQWRRA